jgi:hypothetical protein
MNICGGKLRSGRMTASEVHNIETREARCAVTHDVSIPSRSAAGKDDT